MTKTAHEALADADEAWTQALDEGGTPGDRFDIMILALLAWGGNSGVTIRPDGSLTPAHGRCDGCGEIGDAFCGMCSGL